jgi:arylsulfatase A-like enzyme
VTSLIRKISRRQFLRAASALAALHVASAGAPAPHRGIVLILVDDLFSIEHYRTKFGVRIETPNFDRLMQRGVSFMNAFCSTALCAPSRTSILTGLNPFKTGVHYNYDYWPALVSPEDTLFAFLKHAGWNVYVYGKCFHSFGAQLPHARYVDHFYNALLMPDPAGADRQNLDAAIYRMKHLPANRPYFMTIGIYDPHLPFVSEKRFRDLYPLGQIRLPSWRGDNPPNWVLPWLRREELRLARDAGSLDNFIRGYLANISEMDFSLGRLIDNIDAHARNPLIILSSDHGYTMGEHDHLGKFTLWDEAGRAPLIVIDPASTRRDARVEDVVSLLDIAPTILDYAGVSAPVSEDGAPRMDGVSLRRMVRSASVRRESGALTTMFGSTSLRRTGYRYTRYEDGAEEMFWTRRDPECTDNLADHPDFAGKLASMRLQHNTMRRAWMGRSPKCRVTIPPHVREIC